jgi:hypothetical protein
LSDYRLQIINVKAPHEVAKGWEPGDRVETDLVEDLCNRLKGNMGLRTEEAILRAVRASWKQLLLDLKRRI